MYVRHRVQDSGMPGSTQVREFRVSIGVWTTDPRFAKIASRHCGRSASCVVFHFALREASFEAAPTELPPNQRSDPCTAETYRQAT